MAAKVRRHWFNPCRLGSRGHLGANFSLLLYTDLIKKRKPSRCSGCLTNMHSCIAIISYLYRCIFQVYSRSTSPHCTLHSELRIHHHLFIENVSNNIQDTITSHTSAHSMLVASVPSCTLSTFDWPGSIADLFASFVTFCRQKKIENWKGLTGKKTQHTHKNVGS